MSDAIAGSRSGAKVKRLAGRDERIQTGLTLGLLVAMAVAVLLPLYSMLSKSVEQKSTEVFVGLENYRTFLETPALFQTFTNSLWVSGIATFIVILIAFGYAYALTRTCMPFKPFFRLVSFVPLLSPSLLGGISLVYWFGNQGVAKAVLGGESIYGPIGIVIGSVYWVLPHVLMILVTALSICDGRLYEAASVLGASRIKRFLTVTLPGVKYGLISAFFVAFTLIFTDFGVPKVIGGNFNMLATEIYKQVIGQQNFQMGAVVSVFLLAPAVLAFTADRIAQRRQVAQLSARAVPYEPKPEKWRDMSALIFCTLVAAVILAMIGMAQFAALVKFWPYNLTIGLKNFNFERYDASGWSSFWNSIQMAGWTAVFGTPVVLLGAYLVEKSRVSSGLRGGIQALAIVPLAVPGMVLGLSYIFFFNEPGNPLNGLYGTMAILVLCTVVHFYTVSHLTAVTSLKQLDPEFESVSASLRTPFYRTLMRVTLPISLPSILDISIYFFLNAMTTVSAVVFLYSTHTKLASVAVLNMDDAGNIAGAAAMAMMIVYTCAAGRLVHAGLSWWITKRTQIWRTR